MRWLPLAVVLAGCPRGSSVDSPADTDAGDTDAAETDAGDTVKLEGIAYPLPEGGDAAAASLDVYYRPDGQPKRLVLLVHGGSWVGGDKANFDGGAPGLVPWWLDRGYVAVAPNFRLATTPAQGDGPKPVDQARDLANALRWAEDHKDDYGITEDGAVLFGFSSGAHLVALLGADERYVENVQLPAEHIAATISLDVHAYDVPYAVNVLMPGSEVEDNIPLITHLFGSTEAEQLEGSPIHFTDGHVADALLLSAEPDPGTEGTHGWIVTQAANRYVDALQQAGHSASAEHFSAKSHNALASEFGGAGDGPTAAVEAFLDGVF